VLLAAGGHHLIAALRAVLATEQDLTANRRLMTELDSQITGLAARLREATDI
jgi:hypothetical protein